MLRLRGVDVPQVFMSGLHKQDRTLPILTLNAYVNEIQAGDFGQANIQSADAVAGSDYQAVGYTGIRRLNGNVANYVELVPAPFRIQFAQGGLADAPSENVPRTDMSVHVFDLAPPILGRLAHIPHIFTHFYSQNIENPESDSATN